MGSRVGRSLRNTSKRGIASGRWPHWAIRGRRSSRPRASRETPGTLRERWSARRRSWQRIRELRAATSIQQQFWEMMPACAGSWRSIDGTRRRKAARTVGMRLLTCVSRDTCGWIAGGRRGSCGRRQRFWLPAAAGVRGRWGKRAIHNAVLSDNDIKIFEELLEHGADPTLITERSDRWQQTISGRSAVAMAARRGRGDLLELFRRRGISIELPGVEGLMAACAINDAARVRRIAESEPQLVGEIVAEGGRLLAEFAGVGNTEGVRHLIELGVEAGAVYKEGDEYFDVAKNSTALHVAAWHAQHATVKLLIERGAPE